jgi:hypothetical protein
LESPHQRTVAGVAALTIPVAPLFWAKCSPISFGQYQRTGKFRRECFSGDTVGKTPAKIIALIVAATRDVMHPNSAAGMEFVHWV